MTIETVGELIQYLQRYNPTMRIFKSELFVNAYSPIVCKSRVYQVKKAPGIDLDNEAPITDGYIDAEPQDTGSFEAVVL